MTIINKYGDIWKIIILFQIFYFKNLFTNDFVFKRIFGRKGNEDITKGLIKSILKQEINELSLDENTILEKDFQDDKIGILDIKAKINNSDIVNIEMQVIKYSNIQKRIMFYWSKLYTDEIKSGDDYNNLKKQ